MSQAVQERVECLGCGKATDPLRAGHVAILDGQFRYFCGLACKAAYVSASPKISTSLDHTADPPRVAAPPYETPPPRNEQMSGALVERSVESGTRSRSHPPAPAEPNQDSDCDPDATGLGDEPPARPTMRSYPSATVVPDVEPVSVPSPSVAPERTSTPYLSPSIEYADDLDEEEPASLPAPLTLRSGAASSPVSVRPVASREALVLPVATVAVGVATFAAPLAGFGALPLRAGLALVAGALLLVWTARKPKALGEDLPVVSALAPLGLVIVACVAVARHIDQAGVIASTAGAAVAFNVLSQLLVLRAEADVRAYSADLSSLVDGEARRILGSEVTTVDTTSIRLGDKIVVREGETLSVDGEVVEGTSTVVPWAFGSSETTKRVGDPVIAGLRVVSGELVVVATAVGRERLVTKPFVGREISGLFGLVRTWTPRSLPLVCALVGAAEFASNASWLVVIAAALGAGASLSVAGTLATLTLATARAQQDALASGIAFKDPRALEVAGMSDVAVLCSRGTVLMGEPEVIAVDSLVAAYPKKRVLAFASGAEATTSTPSGKALLGAAASEGSSPEPLRSVLRHDGLGVTALLANGEPLVVGSRALLLKERISVAASEDRVRELEAQGASVLLVGIGGKLVGLVGLQDALRPGARAAIQRLLDARVEPVLVSGETREACETLARALDIEHVRPEVLPADRAAEVRTLGEGGHVVAVLGRVPSDDAALAAADVSIALGSIGQSGDFSVVLATDDVRSAAHALSLARALRERARVGLGSAFAPTLIAVLGLGFGVMPLVLAPVAGFLATVFGLLAVRRVSSEEEPRPSH